MSVELLSLVERIAYIGITALKICVNEFVQLEMAHFPKKFAW